MQPRRVISGQPHRVISGLSAQVELVGALSPANHIELYQG